MKRKKKLDYVSSDSFMHESCETANLISLIFFFFSSKYLILKRATMTLEANKKDLGFAVLLSFVLGLYSVTSSKSIFQRNEKKPTN